MNPCLVRWLCSGAMAVLASTGCRAFDLGVNIHHGGSPERNEQVAVLMQQRGLKTARMDLIFGKELGPFRDQVQRIKARGGAVEVSLQPGFQWDHTCSRDLAGLERAAYEQSRGAVDAVKDLIGDFELLNEAQLRPEVQREVPWNSVGTSVAPYAGKACVASLAAALRGMSRAVRDVAAASGLPLRIILGVVGRDFGFLTAMQQQGVQFDVVGFHVYPHHHQASLLSDPWYGPGGPLAQLAAFGKPVHINEMNCGEIYRDAYENEPGKPVTESCLRSLAKHLGDLRSQAVARIESVHIYELLDEPAKQPPESRFGLMYELGRPKPHLALVTAFAGAPLTQAEESELTGRKLLDAAQIAAMRRPRARP